MVWKRSKTHAIRMIVTRMNSHRRSWLNNGSFINASQSLSPPYVDGQFGFPEFNGVWRLNSGKNIKIYNENASLSSYFEEECFYITRDDRYKYKSGSDTSYHVGYNNSNWVDIFPEHAKSEYHVNTNAYYQWGGTAWVHNGSLTTSSFHYLVNNGCNSYASLSRTIAWVFDRFQHTGQYLDLLFKS